MVHAYKGFTHTASFSFHTEVKTPRTCLYVMDCGAQICRQEIVKRATYAGEVIYHCIKMNYSDRVDGKKKRALNHLPVHTSSPSPTAKKLVGGM